MQTYQLPNIGYWLSPLDPQSMRPVWDELNVIESTIDQTTPNGVSTKIELHDCKEHVASIVRMAINQYNIENNWPHQYNVLGESRPLKLYNLWANFMSKTQYEPIHDHGGVMSFVIWLRIPYNIPEELAARPQVPENCNTSGRFSLHSINALGRIQHTILPLESTWENVLCLFPAPTHHSAFPFYSGDGLRVSIAGNFFFDDSPEARIQ